MEPIRRKRSSNSIFKRIQVSFNKTISSGQEMKRGNISDLYNQIQNKTNVLSIHVIEENSINRPLFANITLLDKNRNFTIQLDKKLLDKTVVLQNEKIKRGSVKSKGLHFDRQIQRLITEREKKSSKMAKTSSFIMEMAVPALAEPKQKARSIDVKVNQTSDSLVFKFEGRYLHSCREYSLT